MPAAPLVVIKVGGSLLSLPDLAARLTALWQPRPDLRPVLIAGGGAVVEAVRDWDAIQTLGEAASHDLALEAMNVTARLLSHLLPRGRIVESKLAAETCWSVGELPVLRMQAWLNTPESDGDALPKSWDVTSDSLAGWVAQKWRAEECWLLKSTDLPPGISPDEASRAELVDRFFPKVAAEVRGLRWCNLRSARPKLQCF